MQHYLIILLSTIFLLNTTSLTPIGVLEIKINNIEHHQGTLWVGIYPSESTFLRQDKVILHSIKNPSDKRESIVVNNLQYGEYAVALFHDLNNNGTLDMNWMGIPSEPYAFSRPLNSKWRVPEFKEVKVNLYQSQKVIYTSLTTWWNQ